MIVLSDDVILLYTNAIAVTLLLYSTMYIQWAGGFEATGLPFVPFRKNILAIVPVPIWRLILPSPVGCASPCSAGRVPV